MSFLELAQKRYSVRKYKDISLSKELVMKVLEAGRIAPSAVNAQPWYFIVVQDKQVLERVASTYKKDWLKQAPVIIVICGDHNLSWRRKDSKDLCDIDTAIAIDHMTLAATDLGLGTCWVCAFDAERCSEIFNLPEHVEPIALLPLGYPADEVDIGRHEFKRKKLEEIVFWDSFVGKQ